MTTGTATVVRLVLLAGDVRLDVAVPAHLPVLEVADDLVALARRAGAAVPAGAVLVRAGRGPVDLAVTPHTQGVRHGEIWAVQSEGEPVPLRVHHDLAAEVDSVVAATHRSVDPEAVRLAVVVAWAVLGVVVAVLTWTATTRHSSGASPWWMVAPALLLGCGLLGLSRTSPAERGVEPSARVVVCAGSVVLNAGLLGCGVSRWLGDGALPAAWTLAAVAVAWTGERTREWAAVPAVLALGVTVPHVVAGAVEGAAGASVAVTLLPVLLLLALGPLATMVVDVRVVRRSGEPGPAAVTRSATGSRVASAVRLVVAFEVATMLLTVVALPTLLGSGPWGLGVWASSVGLFLLRGRGERLLLRALTAWTCAAAVLLAGVGWWCVAVDAASGLTVVLVLTAVAALAAAARTVSGVGGAGGPAVGAAGGPPSPSRALVWLDRGLRVALPSVWLLSSGLL